MFCALAVSNLIELPLQAKPIEASHYRQVNYAMVTDTHANMEIYVGPSYIFGPRNRRSHTMLCVKTYIAKIIRTMIASFKVSIVLTKLFRWKEGLGYS